MIQARRRKRVPIPDIYTDSFTSRTDGWSENFDFQHHTLTWDYLQRNDPPSVLLSDWSSPVSGYAASISRQLNGPHPTAHVTYRFKVDKYPARIVEVCDLYDSTFVHEICNCYLFPNGNLTLFGGPDSILKPIENPVPLNTWIRVWQTFKTVNGPGTPSLMWLSWALDGQPEPTSGNYVTTVGTFPGGVAKLLFGPLGDVGAPTGSKFWYGGLAISSFPLTIHRTVREPDAEHS